MWSHVGCSSGERSRQASKGVWLHSTQVETHLFLQCRSAPGLHQLWRDGFCQVSPMYTSQSHIHNPDTDTVPSCCSQFTFSLYTGTDENRHVCMHSVQYQWKTVPFSLGAKLGFLWFWKVGRVWLQCLSCTHVGIHWCVYLCCGRDSIQQGVYCRVQGPRQCEKGPKLNRLNGLPAEW